MNLTYRVDARLDADRRTDEDSCTASYFKETQQKIHVA